MTITATPREEYFKFINKRLKANYTKYNATIMANVVDNKIKAVLVFHTLVKAERRVDVAIASDMSKQWLTRNFIDFGYRLAFHLIKAHRVQCYTKPDNEASIKLIQAMGFKQEALLTDWYGPQNPALVFYLLKQDIYPEN
jgi:hypothetical protein